MYRSVWFWKRNSSRIIRDRDIRTQSLHIETGQYFRSFIEEASISAKYAHKIYIDGKRQPDFLAISMWGYMLCKDFTGSEHLIFDGAPRSLAEAHVVQDALTFYNRFNEATATKPKVVYLDVSHDWSIKRMDERGRLDDKKEEEEVRSSWFETDVTEAIHFFENNPKFDFIRIQAERPVQEVHAEIISHFA
jgi:adenylate kinase family enzyme